MTVTVVKEVDAIARAQKGPTARQRAASSEAFHEVSALADRASGRALGDPLLDARSATAMMLRPLQTFSRRPTILRAVASRRCLVALPSEPSETKTDDTPKPRPPHELLAADDPDDKFKKTKKMLLGGSGFILANAGAAAIAYNHWAWLALMIPDALGATAITAGIGLASVAAASGEKKKDKAAKGPEFKFELVPLEDKTRYRSTIKALSVGGAPADKDKTSSSMMGGGSDKDKPGSLHPELTKALDKAEKAAAEAAKTADEEATKALVTEYTTALEDGSLLPKRARQKLRPRVFVVDFDVRAPQSAGPAPARPPSMRELNDTLREQVSFLLTIASPYDEVVLRVNSPGGAAHEYGLAGAQFARLKNAAINTTACVDLVAASGGYMLACTAGRIVAAPFAILGSIGVIAGAPNVSKLLDKSGVEYVQRTAGEYKRTINILTPNTEEGLKKFEEDIQVVHDAFIEHVTSHRPHLVPSEVCTGETWLGVYAMRNGLIDEMATSDAYLRARQEEAEVLLLKPKPAAKKQGLLAFLERMETAVAAASEAVGSLVGWGGWARGGAAAQHYEMEPQHAAEAAELARAPPLLAAAAASGGPLGGEAARLVR